MRHLSGYLMSGATSNSNSAENVWLTILKALGLMFLIGAIPLLAVAAILWGGRAAWRHWGLASSPGIWLLLGALGLVALLIRMAGKSRPAAPTAASAPLESSITAADFARCPNLGQASRQLEQRASHPDPVHDK